MGQWFDKPGHDHYHTQQQAQAQQHGASGDDSPSFFGPLILLASVFAILVLINKWMSGSSALVKLRNKQTLLTKQRLLTLRVRGMIAPNTPLYSATAPTAEDSQRALAARPHDTSATNIINLLNQLVVTLTAQEATASSKAFWYSMINSFLSITTAIASALNFVTSGGAVSTAVLYGALIVNSPILNFLMNPFVLAIYIAIASALSAILDLGTTSNDYHEYAITVHTIIGQIGAELAVVSTFTDEQLLDFYTSTISNVQSLQQSTNLSV